MTKCDQCKCVILSYNFFKVYDLTLCMSCFEGNEYITEKLKVEWIILIIELTLNMKYEYHKCGCGKWDLDSVICEKHQTMFRVADKI